MWKARNVKGVALGLVLGLLAASGAAWAQASIEPQPRDGWWMKRHEQINARVAEGNVDLIFVGDSITQGWEGAGKDVWPQYYGNRNAANLGISGDRTEHVLWRLENGNIAGIDPKVAVVMIGTNNVPVHPAEDIITGITAIVDKLHAELPNTHVLLLAVFPRADVPEPMAAKLPVINQAIAKLDARDSVTFLDINRVFLDAGGNLPKTIMPDLLHPNTLGYRYWAAALEPTLARLLGETEPAPEMAGAKPLFNGENLDGWEVLGMSDDAWGASDGILFTTGGEGGWIVTDGTYADFDLQLEFRVPAGGNSGVFIRAPRTGNAAFEGSEIQVLDDYADVYANLEPWQYCGSIYATAAPSQRVTLPAGVWQTMRIRCEGRRVRVWLNSHPIIDADLNDHLDKLEEHPGLKRTEGYIGLQNHGSRLEYRNIKLLEL